MSFPDKSKFPSLLYIMLFVASYSHVIKVALGVSNGRAVAISSSTILIIISGTTHLSDGYPI
jgi:hypothetical protein